MSKNKIILDLRRIHLTESQRKDLHDALHKTVVKELKKPDKAIRPPTAARMAATIAKTANITVTFTNTDPGKSSLTATLNGNAQTVSSSGSITFMNVNSGDIITIDGESLGNTTASIDISADPMLLTFSPGLFNDNFFIN